MLPLHDPLQPEYGTTLWPVEEHTPEQRLLLAILERAVRDLVAAVDPKHRRSAQAWLSSESEEPFTCRWCCQHVGLPDPAEASSKHLHLKRHCE